jgi:hypothetical protein
MIESDAVMRIKQTTTGLARFSASLRGPKQALVMSQPCGNESNQSVGGRPHLWVPHLAQSPPLRLARAEMTGVKSALRREGV